MELPGRGTNTNHQRLHIGAPARCASHCACAHNNVPYYQGSASSPSEYCTSRSVLTEFAHLKYVLVDLDDPLRFLSYQSIIRKAINQTLAKRDAAINQISGKRDAAINQISGKRNAAINQISGKRDAAINQISRKRNAAINQISSKRDAATN